MLKQAGADEVRVIDFTHDFASWTPERFLGDVIRPLHPRPGRGGGRPVRPGGVGNGGGAAQYGRGQFEVTALSLVQFESEDTCSADPAAAGRRQACAAPRAPGAITFRFSGVVLGDRRGRELGFPTANLPVRDLACPADGGYLRAG